MRIINHNLSITYPSIGTSPMSLASQWWRSASLGTAQGLGRTFISVSRHFISLVEAAFGITPMTFVSREPILKYISFQLSPTHYQVLWGYSKIGMVSHPNPTISFYQSHIFIKGHIHLQNSQ